MLGVQSSEALIWRSHRASWAKDTCRRRGTVTALLCRRQVIPLGLFIAPLFTLQWRCTVNISAKFLLSFKKNFLLGFPHKEFFFFSQWWCFYSRCGFIIVSHRLALWLWVTKWWRGHCAPCTLLWLPAWKTMCYTVLFVHEKCRNKYILIGFLHMLAEMDSWLIYYFFSVQLVGKAV